MTKYKLVATAAAGIEALVGKELRHMGYDVQVENGKAFFEGDDSTRSLNKQRRFLGRKFFQSMRNSLYLVNL